jgi:hypothetical protein
MISEKDTDEYLAEILEILKQRFEGGDKSALLYAVYHCLLMKRPSPEWLRLAFLDAYQAHARFEIRTWDEVFGPPVPKGTHLKTRRQHAELRVRLLERVRELGGPIQPDLFDRIGEELGIGATTASSLYYDEHGQWLRELDAIADRLFGASEKN